MFLKKASLVVMVLLLAGQLLGYGQKAVAKYLITKQKNGILLTAGDKKLSVQFMYPSIDVTSPGGKAISRLMSMPILA